MVKWKQILKKIQEKSKKRYHNSNRNSCNSYFLENSEKVFIFIELSKK